MLHVPPRDDLGRFTTHELVASLLTRPDAENCLFSLLGLMITMSDDLSIERQLRWGLSLVDAAEMILKSAARRREPADRCEQTDEGAPA